MPKLPVSKFAPKERDLERAASDLLKLDGWRVIVTDPPQLRGLGVSEKGIPDRLYLRYADKNCPAEEPAEPLEASDAPLWDFPGQDQILWIEWKRPGGKASAQQKAWHILERKRGALIWVSGEDFPATHDGFLEHYRKSGLNRRPI